MEETQTAEVVETTPQELSVEERFAKAAGLEDEPAPVEQEEQAAEDSAEEAPTEDSEIEIEYEGEKYVVPPKLKDALLRQADYTRKTQEVAEQRKAVEAEKERIAAQAQAWRVEQQVNSQLMQHMGQVQAIDSQLAQFQQLDWAAVIDSDPVNALKLQQQFQTLKDQKNNLVQQAIHARQQIEAAQAEMQAKTIHEGEEKLKAEMPDWGPELKTSIRNYGKDIGFTDAELSNITDPRAVRVLADAMRWRQMQAKQPEVSKRVGSAPKPMTVKAAPKTSERDVLRKVINTSKDKQSKHAAIQKWMERIV